MKTLVSLIAGAGDWLVSLSDSAKKQLVVAALLLLVGGGIYKLVISIGRLSETQPAASVDQLIRPMETIVQQQAERLRTTARVHQRASQRLDSLQTRYSPPNSTR